MRIVRGVVVAAVVVASASLLALLALSTRLQHAGPAAGTPAPGASAREPLARRSAEHLDRTLSSLVSGVAADITPWWRAAPRPERQALRADEAAAQRRAHSQPARHVWQGLDYVVSNLQVLNPKKKETEMVLYSQMKIR